MRKKDWLLYLTAFVALAYVLARTILVGVIHDEAYTFNWYMDDTAEAIIRYGMSPLLPNNHVLNTLGMKIFTAFGTHPFYLRLTALVAFALFLWGSLRWLQQMELPVLRLAGLVLLIANPYVLDFFGLARGYGMAMAFMALSCYQLFAYLRQPGWRSLNLALVTGLLSVESNFTLLNFYLALAGVFSLVFVRLAVAKELDGRTLRRHIIRLLLISLLVGVLVERPLRRITSAKQLFGGNTGFWHDTVESLLRQSLYGQFYADGVFPWFNTALMLLLAAMAGLFVLILFREGRNALKQPFAAAFLLLSLSALSIIIQHIWLGTEYLQDRTGIFFLLLTSICLVCGLEYIAAAAGVTGRRAATSVALLLVLLQTAHLAQSANLKYVLDWKYDANTLEMLNALEKEVSRNTTLALPVRLGANPHFEPSINFYRKTLNMDWLQPVHQDGFDRGATEPYPYGYIFQSDLENPARRGSGQIIQQFKPSDAVLVQ